MKPDAEAGDVAAVIARVESSGGEAFVSRSPEIPWAQSPDWPPVLRASTSGEGRREGSE